MKRKQNRLTKAKTSRPEEFDLCVFEQRLVGTVGHRGQFSATLTTKLDKEGLVKGRAV